MTVPPTDPAFASALPTNKLETNAVADRLIAEGNRPLVLGFVALRSVDEASAALFEALAHVSNGADGIDLSLPAALTPGERLVVADQFAEATGTPLYLRTDVPMAAGKHTLIVSATAGRLRSGLHAIYDIGLDQSETSMQDAVGAWPALDDDRSLLVSSVGFAHSSDAALMGLASAASARGLAAISTDRPRIVRRVVDTLAPLYPKVSNAGASSCR